MAEPVRPIGAVLFDLDGTLLDTAPDLAGALNRLRARHGHPPLPYASIRPFASHGSFALTRLGFDYAEDSPEFESTRLALLDVYHAHVADETTLFPGMDALLRAIEQAGLRWGIVTNKPGWLTEPLLAAAARYRARPLPFLLAIVGAMVVHALNAVTLWCVAGGLGVSHPSLAEHCLIMPLATCTGLLPLPLAGLGAMELVVDELYQAAMPGVEGAGAVASIGLRVVSIATNVLISAVLASLGRSGYTLPSVTHQDETSGPGGADS